ncbi:hypothetical protein BJX64DRAFT_284572 [Aspergillus heterothallicus]
MSSYIYRERDREDDWDEPRSSGVSVKRYVIPPEDRERERDYLFRREDSGPSERELVIRRTTEREEPIMIQRYERETDYDRSDRDYYERKYTVTERPRRNPNPIVIREDQPVIIQEARGPVYINPRESDYEMIHRSEVDREPAYYYHRRVREYDNDDRRIRRELSPSDSVSQATRRREDDYSSDDSMVYIRKETKEYDDHHRRHLASGALVGVGAAELIRSRSKKQGEEVSGGIGRLGRDVGAGALGAVAVEAASRAKDYYRSKSRHRSHSFDDDRSSRYSHHRHYSHSHSRHRRSRSRSHSRSRARTFAEIGLGAAAIAGAVALARKKSDNDRRSRSRHRRGVSSSRSVKGGDDDKRSQSRRRKHMAEAGLAGAAVAGLVERARSKSRSRRSRSRSKSKLRKALPVVAAGLGSAVAANVWEKKKDKEGEEAAHRKDRRRSRSRGRPPSEVYPDPTRDSAGLIEYGDHPVTGSIPAANYYGRPVSSQGYHTDASDPVARGAAGHRGRTRSRSRSRARFSSSSPESSGEDRRRRRSRHRHRSRSRDLAGAALAATGVGYAAHKYSQHREREREDRDKQRYDDGRPSPYEEPYSPGPYAPSPTLGASLDPQFRPANYYPPPPGSAPVPPVTPNPYNPADYPPPPNAAAPQQYNYPPPPGPDAYGNRPRRADENVSTARNFSPPATQYRHHDGLEDPPRLSTPRLRRRRSRAGSEPPQSKSVAFDVGSDSNRETNGYETDDSDTTVDAMDPGRRRRHRRRRRRSDRRHRSSSDPYRSKRSIAKKEGNGLESDSDATIDLPDRFDREGRLLPQPGDDPLGDRFEHFMKRVNRMFV